MVPDVTRDFLADIAITPSEEFIIGKLHALRTEGYTVLLRGITPSGGVRIRYGISGRGVEQWKHDGDVHAALDSLLSPLTFFSSCEGRAGWEAHLEYQGTRTVNLGIEQNSH